MQPSVIIIHVYGLLPDQSAFYGQTMSSCFQNELNKKSHGSEVRQQSIIELVN